ncbi:ABC transporter permease [Yoonia sediminilitoris]|uniref:Peptide/nickel transport system permease protein n=1 Tax=Yoonia sediminilitoris TaxID=1286148 RepID=A0A2T6KLQ3_9RHOB|nr:ABC transporter permease [Yoonia sediminilitoris]PUB17139.1 peptide/nickel transport system permease protein [Yoonia sediminilitoris]RCW97434.1 peptide/nickel transport system permease protein [Yoonia sediminilitoris]
MIWLIGALVVMAGLAWGFRFAGQAATGNAPKFRDMPYGVAYGYVLGAAVLLWLIWAYMQGRSDDLAIANKFFFLRIAIEGFIIFAIAAWLFRILGRTVGTAWSKKMFRSMPLTAAFGILTILIYAILAIFAGVFAPYGQEQIIPGVAANIVPGGDPALGGNPDFPLGTDQIGRDIMSRLIYGAQNTVGIAFATTLLAFLLGGSFGFLAATLGGWLDQLLSRIVDVLMAIPSLIFALLLMTIASVWAPQLGIPLTVFMVVIIAVIDSTRVYRLARAVGQNIVVMDYIEAAKLRGEGLGYLVFKEILPNATAPLLAEFGLRFCFVFLTIAALSFLGVGIQPPLADWGTMVRDLGGFVNYAQFAPLAATAPLLAAGAIALLTVAVNFVVDWMLQKSSGLKE